MSTRARNLLFWFFVLIFIPLNAGIWAFAQGWRIALEETPNLLPIAIIKTGTLALSISEPRDAEVFIDGKKIKESRRLFSKARLFTPNMKGVTIHGLKPGSYNIEVNQKDYHKWQKTLPVKSGEVTTALAVRLMPREPAFQKIASASTRDILFPNQSFSRLLKLSAGGKDEILEITESAIPLTSTTLPLVLSEKSALPQVLWDSSGTKALTTGRNLQGEMLWLLWNTNTKTTRLENLLARQTPKTPASPVWHPFNPNSILLLSDKKIYEWNIERNKLTLVEASIDKETGDGTVLAYTHYGNALWWLNDAGEIIRYDLVLQTRARINEDRLIPEFSPKKHYTILVAGGKVVITENDSEPRTNRVLRGEQYLLEEDFWKALGKADSISFSPDNKKLAVMQKNKVDIMFLETGIDWSISRTRGEIETIKLPEGDTKEIIWLPDSAHFFVQTEKNLWFSELDGRDGRNIWKIMELETDDKLFFDFRNDRVYIQSKDSLSFAKLNLKS